MELDEAGNRHLEPWSKASKKPLASDALPLPVGLTNKIFFVLFFSASYFLMRRWREKVRTSMPLHILTLGEIFAIVAQISSFIYLLGFFGIDYVQYFIGKDFVEDDRQGFVTAGARTIKAVLLKGKSLEEHSDEDIVCAISSGEVPCHSLEAFLKDCKRATSLRRRAIEQITGRSLTGLPLEGFDYSSILGQCCEMPIGYVQVPVGVAGPLLLDGIEYMLPLATTEGTLIESANRGCKAIRLSGGANSIILRDGMSRAPVVRFGSAQRAAEFKFYVEHPDNFELLCHAFKSTSKYCRLQSVQCAMAGRNLYMRFVCSTGDAMGMNMVTKGAERVLKDLKAPFPDMDVLSVSGNYCADKKATAVNWIQGRCKSVICESVIKGEVVSQVFKTTVPALVELNMLKNLAGSAIAGGLGGFNAHVSNIVTAIFIATGQDPAQNVESSQCITLLEEANGGSDLHVSVTMPCIEVGTTGGGTKLASQGACLNLLGVKGPNETFPGLNAQSLARIVAGAVLAGELSLLATQAKGELVKSPMKYNRSNRDICGGMLSTSVEKDQ